MPVIRPEQQYAQRCRKLAAPDARANADEVVAPVELRLDQNRPPVHLAEIGKGLLEGWKGLLLIALHIADDITIADRVVSQLAPQSQLYDICVEPESPLPINPRVQIKRQGDPIAQGVSNRRIDRVLDPGMKQEYTVIDVHVRGAHLEHAVQRIRNSEYVCFGVLQGSECQQEPVESLCGPLACWVGA